VSLQHAHDTPETQDTLFTSTCWCTDAVVSCIFGGI